MDGESMRKSKAFLFMKELCYSILFVSMSSRLRHVLKALNKIAFVNCFPKCLVLNEYLMNDSYCYFFNRMY